MRRPRDARDNRAMQVPLYQVDAFTGELFAGNPAAVCPLREWLPGALMQRIAAENNLSETAFFVPKESSKPGSYHLRWFTPMAEVDLCGHATLATAFVLFELLAPDLQKLTFDSRSGPLEVTRKHQLFVLDFPATEPREDTPPPQLDGLGKTPREVLNAGYWLTVFESEADVRALRPDMRRLAEVGKPVIATAPGNGVDFVSRFFAPGLGIDEDPVTGSAHCIMTPYWSRRLEKRVLSARQLSARGGELRCEASGDRVLLAGRARLYMTGAIHLPD